MYVTKAVVSEVSEGGFARHMANLHRNRGG